MFIILRVGAKAARWIFTAFLRINAGIDRAQSPALSQSLQFDDNGSPNTENHHPTSRTYQLSNATGDHNFEGMLYFTKFRRFFRSFQK